MWNDTDIPIAYFITFPCYGTWLHGDDRGSIDRFNNIYGEPYLEGNENLLNFNKSLLKSEPFVLNSVSRGVVEAAVREVCLFAIGVCMRLT